MENIQANLILEILGRPVEHIKQALTELTENLEKEKGVKVVNKKLHEPVPIKEAQSLFTAFAEIEAEFETIESYLGVLFAYMPAHTEIIQPEKLPLSNTDLNELANTVLVRLHNYDAVTKKVLNERLFLIEKIKEEAPELFKKLTTPPEQPKTENSPEGKKSKKKKSK